VNDSIVQVVFRFAWDSKLWIEVWHDSATTDEEPGVWIRVIAPGIDVGWVLA
jgi:hypothetical protein